MKPLQARALDPLRTILNTTRVEIKCRAHAEHEPRLQPGEISSHEQLLFWGADTDPDDVGFQVADGCYQILFFIVSEVTKRRGMCTDDVSVRESLFEIRGKLLRNSLLASIKEVRVACELLAPEYLQHEIRPGNTLHLLVPLPVPHPHRRHASGHCDQRTSIGGSKIWISLCLHDAMHTDHADVSLVRLIESISDAGDGALHIKRLYVHSE